MTCHRGKEAHSAVNICPPILEGNFARFAYSLRMVITKINLMSQCDKLTENIRETASEAYLQRSEVNDTINIWMRFKDFIEVLLFSDVRVKEVGSLAADEFNSIDDLL